MKRCLAGLFAVVIVGVGTGCSDSASGSSTPEDYTSPKVPHYDESAFFENGDAPTRR